MSTVNMVAITRLVGAALVITGIVAYVTTGRQSVTAFAPAVVGAILLVLGILAGRPERVRTMIHAALVVSLLGVLASIMPLTALPALLTGGDVDRPAAVVTAAVMAVLCLVHLVLGVRSFIAVRRNREASDTS